MTTLSQKDFKTILEYYNKNIPSSAKQIREEAEKILSQKLCRCIKKIKKSQKLSEAQTTGICKTSVLHKKNVAIHGFQCKKRSNFHKFPKSKTLKMKKYNNKTQVNNKKKTKTKRNRN